MKSTKRRSGLLNATLLVVVGTSLAGCATDGQFATLSNGACSAFPRPQYQIKGKTAYDQRWADEATEAGIAGCNWKRPQARPASLDQSVKPADPTKPATFRERWSAKFAKHPKWFR